MWWLLSAMWVAVNKLDGSIDLCHELHRSSRRWKRELRRMTRQWEESCDGINIEVPVIVFSQKITIPMLYAAGRVPMQTW
jgi:hypothetical protein